MSRPGSCLNTCMSRLGSCLKFPCFIMSHVSGLCLSGIAKCLFCVETLVFLAESRSLGPFSDCLLTYSKTVVLVVV